MGAHRSLGEFSIENKDNDHNVEKFILGDTALDNKNISNNISNNIVTKSSNSSNKVELEINDELKSDNFDVNQQNPSDDINLKSDGSKKAYTFADFLAIVFSYLFFFITSKYLNNTELDSEYKHNGVVALLVISLIINMYYLTRPFFKNFFCSCANFFDKLSLVTISAILISGIYAVVELVQGEIDNTMFRNFFFVGSMLYVFEHICFVAGLGRIKEDLDIEKDYLVKDFVNIASTSNLQSATLQSKPLKDLRRNELVYLKVGDILPFDGEVVDGEAIVSKRIYAGEAETNILTKKIYAFAGSRILNGELIIRVDNLWEDTFIYDNISKCQDAINSSSQNIFGKKEYISFSLTCLGAFIINFISLSDFSLNFILSFLISCLVIFSFFKIFIVRDALSSFILKRAFSDNILIAKKYVLDTFLVIKNFVFDFSSSVFSRDYVVESFRLYDERIDESYLLEALFSIFAKSDTPMIKKVNLFIAKKQKIIKAYKLDDYMEYSDCNLVSFLAGTRFVIGEEPFMIEMKVQAQESDFVNEQKGQKVLYVALNDMIVGNFTLTEEFMPAMRKLVDNVNSLESNFYLTSREPEALVDNIGKNAGVSVANIFGGLSLKNYVDKINSFGENIFFSNLNTEKQIMRLARHNIGVFDPVICETSNLDAVIFGDNLTSFDKIVGYIKSYKKFLKHFTAYLIISLVVLVLLSFNPLYILLATVVLSNVFLNLFRFRVSKF